MSDPMNAVEIEDVLSSIRRLVSEDLRPTHKLVSAALNKADQKLILTPALRIVSRASASFPQGPDGRDDLPVQQKGSAQLAREKAAVFGSVRSPDLRSDSEPRERDDTTALDANFLATAMSRINGLSVAREGAFGSGTSETIEAVVAAVGAAVGPEEWEVDGGDPAPQTRPWQDAVWNSDQSADSGHAAAKPVPAAERAASDREFEDTSGPLDRHVDDLLILSQPECSATDPENAQSDIQGTAFEELEVAEPDVSEHAGARLRLGSETEIETQFVGSPYVDTQTDADDVDDADGFLSEDLLRVIVSDMIREELQGGLGERITRNIRKLVRSEISRALASRDFEDVASG